MPSACKKSEIKKGRHVITVWREGGAAKLSHAKACVAPGTVLQWSVAEEEDFEAEFNDEDHTPFAPDANTGHKRLKHKRSSGDPQPVTCTKSDANFVPALNGCWSPYRIRHKSKDGDWLDVDPDVIVTPPSRKGA